MAERDEAHAELRRQKAALERSVDGPFDMQTSLWLDSIIGVLTCATST